MNDLRRRFNLAIAKNDADGLRVQLDQGADPNRYVSSDGRFALMLAASHGHVEVCRVLIEKGADVCREGGYKMTALHEAAKYGHLDVCRLLRAEGAEINLERLHGVTPLHDAAVISLPVTLFLIECGAKIDAPDCHGNTPLHWAVQKDRGDVAEALVGAGANPNAASNQFRTPLHFVVACGSDDPTSRIAALRNLGASASFVPEGSPDDYLSPFQYAVKHGRLNAIISLSEQFNEDPLQFTVDGRTMQTLAGNNLEMKKFLRALETEFAVRRAVSDDVSGQEASPQKRSTGMSPL